MTGSSHWVYGKAATKIAVLGTSMFRDEISKMVLSIVPSVSSCVHLLKLDHIPGTYGAEIVDSSRTTILKIIIL